MIYLSAPIVLLACLCATLPLLLHLLGRATAANYSFPALRFVRAAAIKTARRRKIENIALLAFRMGLFTLLPLALALPFFRPNSAKFTAGKNMALAIVLDNTASMNQLVKGQSAFDLAKLQALRLLRGSDSAAPPEMAIVLCPINQASIVSSNMPQLSDQIRSLTPTGVETDLTPTIRQAEALLNDRNSPAKLIYVLTDMQKTTLHPNRLKNVKFPLAILNLSSPSDNLGITNINVPTPFIAGKPITFTVHLEGTLSTPRNITLKLFSEKNKLLHSRDLLLTGPPFQPITFDIVIPKPGFFSGFLELNPSDTLPLDNRFNLAFKVNPPISVQLCSDNAPQKDWSKDPGFFIRAALKAPGWLQPIISPKISNEANVLYFPQSANMNTTDLKNFLRQKNKSAVVFSSLEPSCPFLQTAGCGKILSVSDSQTPFPVEQTDSADPLLASLGFKGPTYRQLAVTRYVKFRPFDGTDPLLVLSSGDPLLVRRKNFFFFTSPPQLTYGTLPLNPIFPAILAQIAADTVPAESAFTFHAGQPFLLKAEKESPLLSITSSQPAAVLKPGSNQITLYTPGLYKTPRETLAVNCAPETTDLTASPLTDFANLPNIFAATNPQTLENSLAKLAQGTPLWDTLLFIALLILLAETLLANLRKPANPRS